MKSKARRLRVGVAVAATVAALSAVPDAAIDSRPECERAKDWVASHVAVLPQDADGLSAFPVAYRRAIVGALAPSVRHSIVVSRLRELARSPTLTRAQLTAVSDLVESLTVDVFFTPPTPAATAFATMWHEKLTTLFPEQQFIDEFVRLGMPDEGRVTRDTWRMLAARALSMLCAAPRGTDMLLRQQQPGCVWWSNCTKDLLL